MFRKVCQALGLLMALCYGQNVRAQSLDALNLRLQSAQAQHVDSVFALVNRLQQPGATALSKDAQHLINCYVVGAYTRSCRYEKALLLFEQLMEETLPGTALRARALSKGARLYYRLPNSEQASIYLKRSIALYDSLELPVEKLWAVLYHLGPLKASDAQEAMEKVLEGLELLEHLEAPMLRRWYLFELALLNKTLGNQQESERIVNGLLVETEAQKERYLRTQLLSFQANLLPAEGRKERFMKVLKAFHELRDHFNEAQVYMRLSISDLSKSREEALQYLSYATALSDSLQMKVPQLPLFQSWHYPALGQHKKAIRLARQTYDLAPLWGRKKNAYQASTNLSNFYAELGQYDSAYFFQRKATGTLKSIAPQQSAVLAGRMEAQMATRALLEEQEKTAAQEALLLSQEIRQQKHNRNAFIAAAIFLAVVLLYIVKNYLKHKKLGRLLQGQKKDLEQLDRLNKEVFSVIAHDFKGPMLTMGILADALSDAQQKQHLLLYQNDLKSQVQQTELMLENLLNWARAELSIEPGTAKGCNPYWVCQEVLNDVAKIAEKKNIRFESQLPREETLPIHADVLRIVWRNLIGNAIKFSPINTTVEIGWDTVRKTLFVKDQGAGMSQDLQQKIFTQSVLSEPGTQYETGFGLGLFISHTLLQKSGWWIKVQSALNEGSVFQFGPQMSAA